MVKRHAIHLGILVASLLVSRPSGAQVWTVMLNTRTVQIQSLARELSGRPVDFVVYADTVKVASLTCSWSGPTNVCADLPEGEQAEPFDSNYLFNFLFAIDGKDYGCKTSDTLGYSLECQVRSQESDQRSLVGP
jgi:hypothetical protein